MINNLPLVSIIIPTYNQEQYIARAIESCLMQDYENLEVIVSNDCSTDLTTEVLKKYYSRIQVYSQDKNLGRVKNYNKLLYEYAKGEWVINLDGDDFYNDRQFISKAINIIYSMPSPDTIMFLMAGKIVFDEIENVKVKREFSKVKPKRMKGKEYFLKEYFRLNNFSHSATLYRRSAACNINFYSFKSLNTDAHSILRLSLLGDVVLAPGTPLTWRVHSMNESKAMDFGADSPEYLAMLDVYKFSEDYIEQPDRIKWLDALHANRRNRLMNYSLKNESSIQVIRRLSKLNISVFSLDYLRFIAKLFLRQLKKWPGR